MEVRAVAGSFRSRVNDRINEADRFAVGCRLLIGQSQVASPHRCSEAGATELVGRAGCLVGANVEGEVGVWPKRPGHSGVSLNNRSSHPQASARRGSQWSLESCRRRCLPRQFPISTGQPRWRSSGPCRRLKTIFASSAGSRTVARRGKEVLTLRRHLLKVRVQSAGVRRCPAPRATDLLGYWSRRIRKPSR